MLGKVCLKRLRFVLYAVLFFLLTLDITNRTGDGLIATVCIWLALPLAFIAMVWWIYACVRDTVRLLRDGVAPEDAAAFGDNFNDVQMLEAVGMPYLMGNAPEALKERFCNHAPDNDHDGIAWALEEMGV